MQSVKSGSTADGYTSLFYSSEDMTWKFSQWSCWLFSSSQMWRSVRGWVDIDVSNSLPNIFFCFCSFSCCCDSWNLMCKQAGWRCNAPNFYSGRPQFQSRWGHRSLWGLLWLSSGLHTNAWQAPQVALLSSPSPSFILITVCVILVIRHTVWTTAIIVQHATNKKKKSYKKQNTD